MNKILIGIDLGTTVLKAAAFNANTGKRLAGAAHRLEIESGHDGKREQNPKELLKALRLVFTQLRRELGRDWTRVEGISLAAQGGSGLMMDQYSGRALTPILLWNDLRSFRHLEKVIRRTSPAFWQRYTLRDSPGWGLGKVLWFKEKYPRLFKGSALYGGVGEFLYFQLTGIWRQDAGNAIQIGCYNAVTEKLDQRLFDLVDAPISLVAPLRRGHPRSTLCAAMAKSLGLQVGIPVAGPYMDHEAGYLSTLSLSRRPLQCSLGTAWVGNFCTLPGKKPVSSNQIVLPAVAGAGAMVCQPLLTGNVSWDWALAQFVDADHKRALHQLPGIFSRNLLPPEGLVALPWLNMPNPLVPNSIGRGAFFGMNSRTTGDDLLRALMVSMVCEFHRVFSSVARLKQVDSIVLGGGASRGVFFQTVFAALFDNLPVYVSTEDDVSGVRGSLYAFSRKAAECKFRRVPRPGPALRRDVQSRSAYYLDIFQRLYGKITGAGCLSFKVKKGN